MVIKAYMSMVDTFIEYQGIKSPFGIQPRCRLGRLIEVVGNGIGISITNVQHLDRLGNIKQELCDPNKYLLEDYKIVYNDTIRVLGTRNREKKIENHLFTVNIEYNGTNVNTIEITPITNVKHIKGIVCQCIELVPNTVTVSFNGNELKNTSTLIKDIGIENGGTLIVNGDYFRFTKATKFV